MTNELVEWIKQRTRECEIELEENGGVFKNEHKILGQFYLAIKLKIADAPVQGVTNGL